MRLARTLRFDQSDEQIFELPAQPDEWAISGAFEFSDWTAEMLTGKPRQAFANGWLGLESFGRATFIATAKIEAAEYAALIDRLAAHFVEAYGAPDLDAARPVAEDELNFMRELCEDHEPNTILFVDRELVEDGISESFRAIKPREASLDMVAIHGELDDT
ncbi:MAG: DUF6505 family protein [Paracoccaceae bacterium]